MKSIYIAQILPYEIRQRLLGLAAKAEMAQAESPVGRESVAYKKCIEDIDRVTSDAKAKFSHLYRKS
jgi:hypothetical protein